MQVILEKTKPNGPSDVYSYIMILWQLITQKIPFEGCNAFLILGEIAGINVSVYMHRRIELKNSHGFETKMHIPIPGNTKLT